MARKKRVDPKAKQRKQAIVLVVGLVLLAGVMAFQLPKLMKSPSSAPTAAPAPASAPSGGAVPSTTAKLVDAPLRPAPGEGQLVDFSLFETKDPFVQQVETKDPLVEQPVPVTDLPEPELPELPPADPPVSEPVGEPVLPTDPSAPSSPSTPAAPSEPAAPAATSATIAVNGVSEVVKVEADFPATEPLFTLVSLSADSAEIAIAGGEYDDGAATVTLQKGKAVTLMNTSDGARYELKLVSL